MTKEQELFIEVNMESSPVKSYDGETVIPNTDLCVGCASHSTDRYWIISPNGARGAA